MSRPLSPQGYNIGEDPTNENPFWDFENPEPGPDVPPGGLTGQVLTKSSDASGDVEWADPPTGPAGPEGPQGPQGPAGQGVPAGGTAGQVLTKKSGTDYDTEWTDQTGGGGGGADLPPGGTTGQVLTKQSDGSNDWQDPPLLNSTFFSYVTAGTMISLKINKVNDQLFTITDHDISNVRVENGVCYVINAVSNIKAGFENQLKLSGIIVFRNSKLAYISLTGFNTDDPSKNIRIDYTFLNATSSGIIILNGFSDISKSTLSINFNTASSISAIFNYK